MASRAGSLLKDGWHRGAPVLSGWCSFLGIEALQTGVLVIIASVTIVMPLVPCFACQEEGNRRSFKDGSESDLASR